MDFSKVGNNIHHLCFGTVKLILQFFNSSSGLLLGLYFGICVEFLGCFFTLFHACQSCLVDFLNCCFFSLGGRRWGKFGEKGVTRCAMKNSSIVMHYARQILAVFFLAIGALIVMFTSLGILLMRARGMNVLAGSASAWTSLSYIDNRLELTGNVNDIYVEFWTVYDNSCRSLADCAEPDLIWIVEAAETSLHLVQIGSIAWI